MSRPGARQTIPLPIHKVPQLDAETIAAALAMLDHWGAMDCAPALGLAPSPPKPARVRGCQCGTCASCRDARPWECPRCNKVMRWGSGARHCRDVHGVER